jgi:hypothetical protein
MIATALSRREDWTDFRNLQSLCRRAGVPVSDLAKVVVKELVDNAIDAGGMCHFDLLPGGGFYVEDNGPGIEGSDADIAELFSCGRPFLSSKHIRLPRRGALGTGLRVVAGAVLASGGSLRVMTHGRAVELVPQDMDGSTTVLSSAPWDGEGTRVEVVLGKDLPVTHDAFEWAHVAADLVGCGTGYRGKSSPWWYDSDSWFEVCQAAQGRTIRELIGGLEGCWNRAGELTNGFRGLLAPSLTRAQTETALRAARERSRLVKPRRLGFVGKLPDYPGYAKTTGTFSLKAARGELDATIPFLIEVWARTGIEPGITACVNRTQIASEVHVFRFSKERTHYVINGCNLWHKFRVGRDPELQFLANIETPHIPLTTDGKTPNLKPVADEFLLTLKQAARRARKGLGGQGPSAVGSQKDIIVQALPAAVAKASGANRYRFSQRQLFYAIRPTLLEAFGKEPDYNWFCQVLTDFEAREGKDIAGIYRDARGVLYHPHEGRDIHLGTLAVEQYRRPAWTFNKVLYCEKEGFFPILKDARWAERHDCALLTSKGYASRAARDVLDLLGGTDEPLTFFCIHDADGPGTMIYQTLQEATRARPGRAVQIVNLGLEPEEALAMQLQVEDVERKGRAIAVASYVADPWREWLQEHRVELNAMSTPQFLQWLDNKMEAHNGKKVVPPTDVLTDRLSGEVEDKLREKFTEKILREAGLDGQVEQAFRALRPAMRRKARELVKIVHEALEAEPANSWLKPVTRVAGELAIKRYV